MEVKAISYSMPAVQFRGVSKKNNSNSYSQQSSCMSQNASKCAKALALAAILAAGSSATTSCVSADADASADAKVWVMGIGNGCDHNHTNTVVRDTIHDRDTVFVTKLDTVFLETDKVPFAIMDSLVAQGVNVGAQIDGPGLGTPNLVYLGSKAFNEYDYKLYESMIEKDRTTQNQLSVLTKVTDFYDEEKSYKIRTLITDVPGRGIKFSREIFTDKNIWKHSGEEIRSNGARGNTPGKNILYTSELVPYGEYIKGENLGTFLYGTLAVDPTTGEITDENVGYSFRDAVIYTDVATPTEVSNPKFGQL